MRAGLLVLGVLAVASSARAQAPRVRLGLDEVPQEATRGARPEDVAVESAGAVGGMVVLGGLGALGGFGVGLAVQHPVPRGGEDPSPVIGALIGLGLAPIGAALGTWLAGDALGRHGALGWTMLAALAGGGLAVGIAALALGAQMGDMAGLPIALGALAVPVFSVLAFELAMPTVTITPTFDMRGVSLGVGGWL